jgi:hypothetical protein
MTNQYDFADESESEDEEVGALKPEQIAQAVLHSADWTTQTIISQLTQGNIDLNPRFQRRDAWTPARKSRFIESLILGLPVPEIVLAERKGQRGKFIILDGKQRLLTLLQFVGQAGDSKYNNFKLSGLEVRDDLNTNNYADVRRSLLRSDLNAFDNSTIRSVVIRNWPNTALLHLIFLRLNTGSVSLSPQELRQALFPGGFIDFVYESAEQSEMLKKLLGIKEPDFRMRDVELLVRYVGFRQFLPKYAGNLRAFLDDTCETLNKQWDERQDEIKQNIQEFEQSIATMIEIFSEENMGRKWTGAEFESRPNRAVLDIMTFYFCNIRIQNLAKKKKKTVYNAFKNLCETDDVFRKSIETTTKSLTATYERLHRWGKALSTALSIKIQLPKLTDDKRRIEFNGF